MIGFLLLVPNVTFAQAIRSPDDDPRKTARVHFGPLYLTPTVTIKDLGVDTNVFNSAGERQRDFTATFTPAVNVWVPFVRRALLTATAGADVIYFHKFENQRAINPRIRVKPEIFFNRLRLFGDGSYLRSRDRPSFEIDARPTSTSQGYQAGLEILVLQKVFLTMSGGASRLRYDEDEFFLGTNLSETLDRDTRVGGASFRYRWTPLTAFVLAGEAITDRFLRAPARNSDSVRITGGVELNPRALVSGSANVGVRRFQTLNDTLPDFQGVVATARLSYAHRGSTTLGFNANRDVDYSFEPTQPYYVADSYEVTVRRQLAGNYDVIVGAGRHQYSYRNFIVLQAGAPPIRRQDITRNLSASIGYRILRTGRLGVGVSYWDRHSNTEPGRDFSGLRAGVSFAYGNEQ